MIEFKITSTADKSQQAAYQHEADEMVIGREEGDLILDDPSVAPRQLRIYLSKGTYYLENLDPSVEIKFAGKIMEEPVSLKGRETFSFGKTILVISNLAPGKIPFPEPYVHPRAEQRFAVGNVERAILDALDHLAKGADPSFLPAETNSPPGSAAPPPTSPPATPAIPKPLIPGPPKPPPPRK